MSSLIKQVDNYFLYSRDSVDRVVRSDLHGFPITSFDGMWYFNRNTSGVVYPNGSPAAGPFLDETGNGNHASILLGATPTKQSWGLDITDSDGLWLDTSIDFPASGTAICYLQSSTSSSLAHHMHWLRPASAGTPATAGSSVVSWAAPHPTLTTTAAVTYFNSHGIIDFDAVELGVVRKNIPTARAPANGNIVVAFRWNDTTGKIELFTFQGMATATIPSGVYGPATGNARIGIIPVSTTRPCTGRLYAAALASSVVPDDVLHYAMVAFARMKLASENLQAFGYVKPLI